MRWEPVGEGESAGGFPTKKFGRPGYNVSRRPNKRNPLRRGERGGFSLYMPDEPRMNADDTDKKNATDERG